MKFNKIFALAALTAAMAGTTACSDVTEPVYKDPNAASFLLNTPPMQDQYLLLTEDGTFEIVCNGQPDYGFSAITNYGAEVSLTEDFAESKTLTPTGTGTLSRMTFKAEDLAIAMCQLNGVTSEDDYVDMGEQKVYFRGTASISGIPSSYVTTANTVTLNRVQAYFALPQPGAIWCIGNYPNGWKEPAEANKEILKPFRLLELPEEIGSKVYYGQIDFQENDIIFRFYQFLSGWDAGDSWGAPGGNDDDNPVPFPEVVEGYTLASDVIHTKDSFSFPNFKGTVNMIVDWTSADAPKALLTAGAGEDEE